MISHTFYISALRFSWAFNTNYYFNVSVLITNRPVTNSSEHSSRIVFMESKYPRRALPTLSWLSWERRGLSRGSTPRISAINLLLPWRGCIRKLNSLKRVERFEATLNSLCRCYRPISSYLWRVEASNSRANLPGLFRRGTVSVSRLEQARTLSTIAENGFMKVSLMAVKGGSMTIMSSKSSSIYTLLFIVLTVSFLLDFLRILRIPLR